MRLRILLEAVVVHAGKQNSKVKKDHSLVHLRILTTNDRHVLQIMTIGQSNALESDIRPCNTVDS